MSIAYGYTDEFKNNNKIKGKINMIESNEAVKLEAVKKNGLAIKHIKRPSEAVKMEAVRQNGNAIDYIKDPSEKIQLEAVRQNGFAIIHIKRPTEEVKKIAEKFINEWNK